MSSDDGGSAEQPARRRWWQRPFIWFALVMLGAVATFLGDRLNFELGSVVPQDELLPQVTGTEAITVVDMTRVHNPFGGRTGYVVAPSVDPPALSEQTSDDTYRRWAEANNAVDLQVSAWEVTLRGRRSQPVEIVDIVPVPEEKCRPPLNGGLLNDSGQGEGDKVVFDADLTAARPTLTRVDPSSAEETPHYFGVKKITLPKDETNVLVLRGKSMTGHCRWRYRIDYVADGRRNSFLLSAPGGKPFEVTGQRAAFADYAWVVPPGYELCPTMGAGVPRPKLAGTEYQAFLNCSHGG